MYVLTEDFMKNKFLIIAILGVAVLAGLYLYKDELSGLNPAGDAPAAETAGEIVAEQPASVVAAQAPACVLKGELQYEGRKIEVNDCMRNDGLAPDAFQATCEWVADYGSAYGERPRVTYVDSCPAAHQGVCDTFFERPITVFYYRNNPDDLASMKSSCDMQKGRWTTGGTEPAGAAGATEEARAEKVADAASETDPAAATETETSQPAAADASTEVAPEKEAAPAQ